MSTTIHDWAIRWNITPQAFNELLDMTIPKGDATFGTENAVQADIRLAASQKESILWRNNIGAITDINNRHVRFGLGNDSTKINKYFKSSDLIGITSININNRIYGIFTAIEVKKADWKWANTEREQAQWKYLNVVKRHGGFATFATSKQDYEVCLITGPG